MTDQTPDGMGPIESELLRSDASFAEIVIPFVEGLAGRIEQMEQALDQQDLDALRVSAHQLKGSGGGYGFPSISARAAELEASAKTGEMDNCLTSLKELRELIGRIVVPNE
jgi:HPt (histidine-containing phosphotransfer) domain-containing protein